MEIGSPAIEPLVMSLHDSDWHVQWSAVKSLDKLQWQPDKDAHGAVYWIHKKKYDKCVEIGLPAVEPLLIALKAEENWQKQDAAAEALGRIGDPRAVPGLIAELDNSHGSTRRCAAQALVRIYHLGTTNEQTKAAILQQRKTITAPAYSRSSSEESCFGYYHHSHEDHGIGIDFPL